jgi:ABC-2 type transport system ATP-binding protein
MIRATDLTKRFNSILALDQLSLEVPPGSVFGLLGPNGAGKTTFLRLVMGFVFADDGQIDRGGLSPAQIGYLPERAFYPPRFTVRSYLQTVGRLAGLHGAELSQATAGVLTSLDLAAIATRRLHACSRGMLQRLGLAQALLGGPSLILLDEPVLGLDPAGQKFMRDQIVALHQEGKTVVLCSHDLDEVTRVCTHIGVLNRGKLVRSGPLETILAPRRQVLINTSPLSSELQSRLTGLAAGVRVTDNRVLLTDDATRLKTEVLQLLISAGADIRQLTEQHATLEEIYLEATSA